MASKVIEQKQSQVISKLTNEKIEQEKTITQQRQEIEFHKRKYSESMTKRKKLKFEIESLEKDIEKKSAREENLVGKITELSGAIADRNLEINQLKHGIDFDEEIKRQSQQVFNTCQVLQVIGIIAIIAFQLTS
jgi:septal ring factor EnvC (AmiA/AmiB activator)|tara:strand:- start:1787 stop:2188 length:402 start_codon:yes stop_codon:yes gene_type:complete